MYLLLTAMIKLFSWYNANERSVSDIEKICRLNDRVVGWKKSQRTDESERENQITKYFNLIKLLVWCGCLNPATVIIFNVFPLEQCFSCAVKPKTLSYEERSSSLFARSNLLISTDRTMISASVATVTAAAATVSMSHTINYCKTRTVGKNFVKYSLIPTSVYIIHVLSPFFFSWSSCVSIRTIKKT